MFSIESMSAVAPYLIKLDGPYRGVSSDAAAVYRQGALGAVTAYQYVVVFDSPVVDVPTLVVNGVELVDEGGTNLTATVQVAGCDEHSRQTVTTAVDDTLGGTFTLSYGAATTKDLVFDTTPALIEAALLSLPTVRNVAIVDVGSVFASGARSWGITLEGVDGDMQALYAEGQLLTGTRARVSVVSDCPTGLGSGTRDALPCADEGCEVQTVAGRAGSNFHVQLDGEEVRSGVATYDGNGLFRAEYVTPRVGQYEMQVAEASCCGLTGEYYLNRWVYGFPSFSRVDEAIDFVWSTKDRLTPTGLDYISIRWTGYLQPTFSEAFVLVFDVNDGARVWLDGQLLLDEFEDRLDDSDGVFVTHRIQTPVLVADRMYPLKIEFSESTGAARAQLSWVSPSQPQQIVPSHRLFYGASPIKDSAFGVLPTPKEPSAPTAVKLAIEDWHKLKVTFGPPVTDGGQKVDKYKIEWHSAIAGDRGVDTAQTIAVENVKAGEYYLMSPGGAVRNPSPVAWNATAGEVEKAIEWFENVGDVEVSAVITGDGLGTAFRYSVTYVTDLSADLSGGVGVANPSLVASDPGSAHGVTVCSDGGVVGSTCGAGDSATGTAALTNGGSKELTITELDAPLGVPFEYIIPNIVQASSDLEGFFRARLRRQCGARVRHAVLAGGQEAHGSAGSAGGGRARPRSGRLYGSEGALE